MVLFFNLLLNYVIDTELKFKVKVFLKESSVIIADVDIHCWL